MTHLSETRLRAPDEADLIWYLHDGAAALGERSSMAALQRQIEEGRVHGEGVCDETLTSRLHNIARARRVEAVLRRMHPGQRAVLELTYGPPPGSPTALAPFAPLGSASLPVALVLRIAERDKTPRKTLLEWLGNGKDDASRKEHQAHVNALRIKALGALDDACITYRRHLVAYLKEQRRRPHADPSPDGSKMGA